ncbi:MAG: hypothetical protein VX647_07545 [Pseudomonadota bacterium]|nr:hypothetical protein [Pseudomonadota bacterium]
MKTPATARAAAAAIPRRSPRTVMRLARLGALHQSRLSFMRVLTRRMAAEGWRFARPHFRFDAAGVGRAVYTATTPTRTYSLVAFGHDLPDAQRSDRVIAEAWDATFTLVDGVPSAADLDRLAGQVPYQEAGRVGAGELCLARANKSARLWRQVVDALAAGRQPDLASLAEVGYLMRTTAVYGSGKFGAADYQMIADRPEMSTPFQAEMLTVYLIRVFVRDLVNHLARAEGGAAAAELDPALATRIGIGNSTGLGMAPFLINHPRLLNNWIDARETAIARVRARPTARAEEADLFRGLVAAIGAAQPHWPAAHPIQGAKQAALGADLARLDAHLQTADLIADMPWDRLMDWAANALSEEGQELVASLMLEPYGVLVDDLAATMADRDPPPRIDGAMTVGTLRRRLAAAYDWALAVDWTAPAAAARAWYVSAEKREPRLGERYEEPIAAYEQPLAPGRDVAAADRALADWPDDAPVADFLLSHPAHRHSVRRIQNAAPYSEIRDNTIAKDFVAIDLLRAKLSFFGATRFDPRSDRWVRICMFAGAPYPADLCSATADRWVYADGAL